MREVFEHPEQAAEKGRRGRADIRERHSLEAAGRVMTARIARAVGGFRTGRGTQGPGAFDATPLRERVSQGPMTPAVYRFGAPQRAARKALLRGLKPYTAHARSVDAGLLQGLEAVNRGLQSLTDRSMRWDAQAARMDDLVGQVDRLRYDLDVALRYLSSFGVGDPAAHSEAVGPWPEAPARPWTPEYVERHREFVTRALDDPALIAALRAGRELPAGFGVGFDERVVEFPWTVTRDLTGRVLDAGSTLNHPHVIVRIRPRVDELDIVTLAPEPQSFPFLDISYLFADLRELPVRDAIYDRVVSISTLEHVGMDNTQYGDEGPRSSDPSADVAQAMAEMRRVLKPEGKLFITVPYGAKADLGWQRVFDLEGLDELVDAFGPREQHREFFRYTAAGWQRSDPQEAADSVYRDHFAESESEPPPDRAVAARAIACVELRP
jgi:SAM-dependent methyltransferase